jgi:hypothetical protein
MGENCGGIPGGVLHPPLVVSVGNPQLDSFSNVPPVGQLTQQAMLMFSWYWPLAPLKPATRT